MIPHAAPVFALHGSEVAGVQVDAAMLRVRLAAAAAQQAGEDGFLGGVTLCFERARWQGNPAACFGNLADAQVLHGGERHLRLPVRFVSSCAVRAEFVFHNGEQLTVEAESLAVHVAGDARWLPSMAC